ncbi:MAG: hypothetical protein HQK89_02120 [Nitrospirae bacterium]|nr:hypothetical protein [Nitrospirota bacterium]
MVNLSAFNTLIRDRCGLRFENNRLKWLEESIINRMEGCGLNSQVQYFNLINDNQEEFTNLVNLLTINETYFFREQGHLALMTDRLVPELLKKIHGRIRILSAGCATGEEPYSIAIALMEKYAGAYAGAYGGAFGRNFDNKFSIFAADIDSSAIKKAATGIYAGNSFRNFDETLMKKYFTPLEQGRYLLKDPVRQVVYFQNTNILSYSDNPDFRDMDIIFYRNVSIYFDLETRKKAIENLNKLLRPDGYLIVSSVETLSNDLGILHPVEIDGVFLYQKSSSHKPISPGPKSSVPTPVMPDKKPSIITKVEKTPLNAAKSTSISASISASIKNKDDGEDLTDKSISRILELINERKYTEALDSLDKAINISPKSSNAYSMKAYILFKTRRFNECREFCFKAIEFNQWNYDAYIILGLIAIHGNGGDDGLKEALRRFKEAIYIDSSAWLAHYHAGDVYRVLNEKDHAEREYSIVIKLLEKGIGSAFGGLGPTLFYNSFNVDQILHLCSHNIKKLKGT